MSKIQKTQNKDQIIRDIKTLEVLSSALRILGETENHLKGLFSRITNKRGSFIERYYEHNIHSFTGSQSVKTYLESVFSESSQVELFGGYYYLDALEIEEECDVMCERIGEEPLESFNSSGEIIKLYPLPVISHVVSMYILDLINTYSSALKTLDLTQLDVIQPLSI